MANNYDEWFPETGIPNIVKLLSVCFSAKMLAATQDVIVDGWALTMLKKFVLSFLFPLRSFKIIIKFDIPIDFKP